MSRLFAFVVVFYLVVSSAFAQNRLPIPEQKAEIDKIYVIKNRSGDEKIVSNQVLIVFKQDVSAADQNRAIYRVNGKLVGGIPAMEIYQVEIANPAKSLDVVESVITTLTKDPSVVHAAVRKADYEGFPKINLKTALPEGRRDLGKIDTGERGGVKRETDPVDEVLAKHRPTLYNCVKNSGMSGQVTFRIRINPAGDVTRVKILKSNVKKKTLTDCMQYKIKKWDGFPKQKQKQARQVDFTFKF